MKIFARDLPEGALLKPYAQTEGCYTDCYALDFPRSVDLADFVTAFYTTPLFKLERIILRFAVSRPSTDDHARMVATGEAERFAAWNVEGRSTDQLLMCDMAGRTRSWFKTEPVDGEADGKTRLFFGSAVVPRSDEDGRDGGLGFVFSALLGFHKLYSRALLYSAGKRLASAVRRPQ